MASNIITSDGKDLDERYLPKGTNIPPNPNAYLVGSWRSGANWWRKWSDGFIEQGGILGTNFSVGGYRSTSNTLSFHIAFSSTDYYVGSVDNQEHASTSCIGRATSTATLQTTARGNNTYHVASILWYACGF